MNLQVHFVSELQFFVWLVLASLQLGVGGRMISNQVSGSFMLLLSPDKACHPGRVGVSGSLISILFPLFPPAPSRKPYLAVPSCPSEQFHTGPEGDLNQGFPPAWGENDLTECEESNHQQFFKILSLGLS